MLNISAVFRAFSGRELIVPSHSPGLTLSQCENALPSKTAAGGECRLSATDGLSREKAGTVY